MKTQKYNCPSYYDDETQSILDCTCGKCDRDADDAANDIKGWSKYGITKFELFMKWLMNR